MPQPHTNSPDDLGGLGGQAITLSFPITWIALSKRIDELHSRPRAALQVRSPDAGRAVVPLTAIKPIRPSEGWGGAADSIADPVGREAHWEMVIPKMTRPPGKHSAPERQSQPAQEPAAGTVPGDPAIPVREDPHPQSEHQAESVLPGFLRAFEEQEKTSSRRLRVPPGMVLIALGVAIIGIAFTLYFAMHWSAKSLANEPPSLQQGPPIPVKASGWIQDFAPNPSGTKGARWISVLRPSLKLTDFRMEFRGRIEKKAMGWVFRARDPRNFYVMKLEQIKTESEPAVALVRFAVLNGVEQPRVRIGLPARSSAQSLYNVRLEAVGSRFTTWIQDRKVDEWIEEHIGAGGVGSYSERGERGSFQGDIRIHPLGRK